ncbi:MAG: relaxase MobL, partial [Dysosmobacter sp.]|nr:relaxase MobL [Dysosmobacter sp.]
MVRLIQKSGYIKAGSASGYMKYIATRERVEKLKGSGPVTKGQQQLVENLLRDFPDTNELDEYGDYRLAPTTGNATALIAAVLDANAHKFTDRDGYMKYIATRPRAERHGEHGLFTNRPVSLDAALKEVETHCGNVWTFIWSLRREDAARLGYDHAENWQKLIKAHQVEIAESMKISPDQLRWYAAFHDEGHHPHVHAMVWSADPKRGRLTKEGVKMIRSRLTNDIFQDEMYALYQEKDVSYKELVVAARRTMEELLEEMRSSSCGSPVIENKLLELSQSLETVKGKKVYGYLKKPAKAQVDAIVDELAKLPEVAECYEVWNGLRDELEGYYKDVPCHRLPLSQQKEFRTIKNLVIQEAENLRQGVFTFEDAEMNDEPEMDSEVLPQGVGYDEVLGYRQAATLLYDDEITQAEKREALRVLEQLWDKDFTSAAYH